LLIVENKRCECSERKTLPFIWASALFFLSFSCVVFVPPCKLKRSLRKRAERSARALASEALFADLQTMRYKQQPAQKHKKFCAGLFCALKIDFGCIEIFCNFVVVKIKEKKR